MYVNQYILSNTVHLKTEKQYTYSTIHEHLITE